MSLQENNHCDYNKMKYVPILNGLKKKKQKKRLTIRIYDLCIRK